MDGWWAEVEDEVTRCFQSRGEVRPREIAEALGVSEDAAASLLAVLVGDGRLRIASVTMTASAPRKSG